MNLTVAQLKAIMPGCPNPLDFIEPLVAAMEVAQCNTAPRAAAFLAQLAHETSELRVLEENLNYSARGLLDTWPSRFTSEQATAYARQPERIANYVYASRLGNGGVASGDGWKYRGRGPQITGRGNYMRCSMAICGDGQWLLNNPELLTDPNYCAMAWGWFWAENNLNALADSGDFEGLTKKINGGLTGYKDRVGYFHRVLAALT
jgi:putative chitinase